MQNNARKNIIYSILLLMAVFIVYLYRQNQKETEEIPNDSIKVSIAGQTMGTNYNVVYLDREKRDFKESVDSLLQVFNQSLSTYIPDSELSRFNRGDSLVFELPYFFPTLKKSREIFDMTDGAFDPTVGPVVNLWGFGPEGAELNDSVDIRALLPLIGFDFVQFDERQVYKTKAGVYLDFSAIAKGYGVDLIADFLESRGIANMLVEIGGELVAKGTNENGELWRVGVNRPEEGGIPSELIGIIALDNRGMATSGNYRNYYVKEGVKYSHTIDPATGYPVQHGLLSATVLAEDCMSADAYATAIMVMGTEKAIELQQRMEGLEIFLIYNDDVGNLHTFASEGLKPYLSFLEENTQKQP